MLNANANYAEPTESYPTGMETMGSRIKTLRVARGYSQQRLAELLGVTAGAVSQWESDSTENIKLPTFLRLCDLLATDPHYLVLGPSRGSQPGALRSRPR